jgi:hypothetical protein
MEPRPRDADRRLGRTRRKGERRMKLLLFVVAVVGFLVSLLPVIYPGSILAALGMPVNVFVAETLRNLFDMRADTLVVMGEGNSHELTLQGVLIVFLPLIGLSFLALRTR